MKIYKAENLTDYIIARTMCHYHWILISNQFNVIDVHPVSLQAANKMSSSVQVLIDLPRKLKEIGMRWTIPANILPLEENIDFDEG